MSLTDIKHLTPGMVVAADVFTKANNKLPLITAGTILTDRLITSLMMRDIDKIGIAGQYNIEHIDVPVPPPIIDRQTQQDAIENLENLFTKASLEEGEIHQASAQIVKKLDDVVDRLVDSIQKDKRALINMKGLKSYDEYTYHHSLSVAVLTIAIGQEMGIAGSLLNQLGQCAMMHDIGKIAVPVSIINKPGKLDDKEFALVKGHSRAGYEYLLNNSIGNETLRRGVLGHHEKFDGTGYPDGIAGESIPVESRIISISDVYDALTSNRSYRRPMQPAEAIEYIMGSAGFAFDYDIIEIFLKKIELYPVGSIIRLSTNSLAVVLNNTNAMRPVVQLLDTGEVLDLLGDRKCLSITVLDMLTEHFESSESE